MENPFVPVYSDQSEHQKARVARIKDLAFDLYKAITDPTKGTVNDPRKMAMAKSYLEIAVMLAVKGVTNPANTDTQAPPRQCRCIKGKH
ncbi:hypothetical protein KAR91_75755 [Candidatus Pacearchaeota archaeon]|nr:hypothetical protein [Candidatus Pacearchaeota archaeon]